MSLSGLEVILHGTALAPREKGEVLHSELLEVTHG
jgi:hypothetical protein